MSAQSSSSVHSYTSVWTAMDRPTLLTVFNEWRTSSHVDACGRLRRQRWSSWWHVVQHWETVCFLSSLPGLGTAYQATSRQRQPSRHLCFDEDISVFSDILTLTTKLTLYNVVLKHCCACAALILWKLMLVLQKMLCLPPKMFGVDFAWYLVAVDV